MGWQIIFAPRALADLEEIVRFIARDNPAAAERFGNSLIGRASLLSDFPLLGSIYPKRPGVRKLSTRPYIIFYRLDEERRTVEILRYWHGAQSEPEL